MNRSFPLPSNLKKARIPYVAVKLIMGCDTEKNWKGDERSVGIIGIGDTDVLHIDDFELALRVSKKVSHEYFHTPNMKLMWNAEDVLKAHLKCSEVLNLLLSDNKKTRIIMLPADDSGCGYWRMIQPSQHFNTDKYEVVHSHDPVSYEELLNFDIIVLQRAIQWEQLYVVKRLRKAGRRVFYEIDDNIFQLPVNHKAFMVFNPDARHAAASIMRECDGIITTNQRMSAILEWTEHTFIYPNSIDLKEWEIKEPNKDIVRILWAGGGSHISDFKTVSKPIEFILKKYPKTVLTIIGQMPEHLMEVVRRNHGFEHRIEFQSMMRIESYIQFMKMIQADIGIAPLEISPFSDTKSNLKWIEMSAFGIPVIASRTPVYVENQKEGETILLAGSQQEWINHLELLIKNIDKRSSIVKAAREAIIDKYDVRKNVDQLSNFLASHHRN